MEMQIKGRVAAVLAAAIVLGGCGREDGSAVPATRLPVAVIAVEAITLEQFEELPGRVVAFRRADVRPQISGIVRRRLFKEGTDVRAGQPLFQIDPAPFKADAAVATAALQRAQTTLTHAQMQVARLKTLVASNAISLQAYDDAVAQRDQAAAELGQARAVLRRRQLDLQFTTVEAPINGRIDQSLVSEGTLVGASDAAPMARIEQIDDVYVDARQRATAPLPVRAPDGKPMAATIHPSNAGTPAIAGTLLFSGVTVDAGTGEVVLRILVANADRQLLPGMFVHARLLRATIPGALMVPQQAVTRTEFKAHLWVVDAQDRARRLPVELGELTERRYVIRSGIQAGARVVIEGADRLIEGRAVSTTSWRPASAHAH